MFKRLMVCIILGSMMMHCAGRLGFLDSLYQQRHRIAYNLGLIADVPIAICSGDYDFDGKLNFQSNDIDETSTPNTYQPREITLFFAHDDVKINSKFYLLNCSVNTQQTVTQYKSPDRIIFQPPKI